MHLSIVLVLALKCLCVQSQNSCPCTPFHKCRDEETALNLDGQVDDRIFVKENRTVVTVRQNDPTNCLDPVLEIPCCNPFEDFTPVGPPSPQPPIVPISSDVPPRGIVVTPGPFSTETPVGSRIPAVGECGVRNMEGVGFTVEGFTDGQAQYGEFPWMVAVLVANTDTGANSGPPLTLAPVFVGGGSLIDPLVVLTAAHKPFDNEGGQLLVRIGEWNFRADTEPEKHQDIRVKEIIYHPRFSRTARTYNYALLVLERSAILGQTVGTICLPSSAGQRFDGQQCVLSGWGRDVFGEQGRFSRILKEIDVNMVGYSQCQSALQTTHLGSSFTLHRSFVCAGDQGQDACTGDGGSPLVCPDPMSPGQYVQVGVSAWGIGCGQPGIPGVYAAVAPAVEWINIEVSRIRTTALDERIF